MYHLITAYGLHSEPPAVFQHDVGELRSFRVKDQVLDRYLGSRQREFVADQELVHRHASGLAFLDRVTTVIERQLLEINPLRFLGLELPGFARLPLPETFARTRGAD